MPNWNYNIIRLLFVSLWFITDAWELTLGIIAFVDEGVVVVDESCDFFVVLCLEKESQMSLLSNTPLLLLLPQQATQLNPNR